MSTLTQQERITAMRAKFAKQILAKLQSIEVIMAAAEDECSDVYCEPFLIDESLEVSIKEAIEEIGKLL